MSATFKIPYQMLPRRKTGMSLVLSSPASESSEQLSAWLELKWTKTGRICPFL